MKMVDTMCNMHLHNYKDILEIRRNTSDFMWCSRELNLTKSYRQYHDLTDPYKFQYDVFRSTDIQRLIEEVSKCNNCSNEEVSKHVVEILKEIGHTRQMAVFRCFGLCFIKVLKEVISCVFVNEAQILKLKSEMGGNPVIFVPSHRSYADFLLMSYITFHYNIEIPCIAAGMDFQSMRVIGKILRDCSAFFMRRSFVDDQLYRSVFKKYVQHLVTYGDAPIEFFIEGTRSRSAKALVPKFGLLNMLVEPFFNGDVPDIYFVPVSFSYECVLEESLFAYEMLGIPKPKESTSGLIKALKIMDEKYGNVHATFSEPISFRKYLTQTLSATLDFTKRDSVEESGHCFHLAYQIVDCQQKNMVLNTFNILAMVLTNHLMVNSLEPLLIDHVSKDVVWLSAVLKTQGAVVQPISHGTAVSVLMESIKVHQSLIRVSASGTISLVKLNNDKCKTLDPQTLRGHKLSTDMMNLAVPMLTLQLYVNPCLHFLINSAIITVIMQQVGANSHINKNSLFMKFVFVRELFAHEFVFYRPVETQEFEDALTKLELLSIIESEPLRLGNHQKLQALFCNLLYPFFSGYLSVCRFLLTADNLEWEERQFLKSAQERIEEELISGWLLQPYCLSLDMISSCIAALTSMIVLSKIRRGSQVHYKVDKDRLIPVISHLESLFYLPQKYQTRDQDSLEDTESIQVISSSEPLQRLVSKL
ncbi:dihydroxyacetone phosphate acyltransferase [Lycorma delicatula]|uniref:dihydroxyacetone phosphate acyltransferase n=1 Tax=Lycorma delicatula TaxID=130591 RepID=UPI003F51A52C